MSKNIVLTALGVVGTIVSNAFGGWSSALTTLCIFMAVDYVSGLVVAGVFHASRKTDSGSLKSSVGWQGLCRKGVMLAVVLIAARLDLLMGVSYLRDGVVIAFCGNELLSITENAGLMGVPLPSVITRAIDILRGEDNGD